VTVQQTAAEEALLSDDAYDVITLWHSLEHLNNPVAVLQKLRPSLRDHGLLLVEVPNRAGWGAKLTGEYWYHWDLPRHRLHFTPASLRLILEQTGFRVEQVQHVPNPHGLAGALAYRFGRPGLARNRLVLALGWLFGLAAALFRRGDVIRATARPALQPDKIS
jgi:SAM-dependent methyltransferase